MGVFPRLFCELCEKKEDIVGCFPPELVRFFCEPDIPPETNQAKKEKRVVRWPALWTGPRKIHQELTSGGTPILPGFGGRELVHFRGFSSDSRPATPDSGLQGMQQGAKRSTGALLPRPTFVSFRRLQRITGAKGSTKCLSEGILSVDGSRSSPAWRPASGPYFGALYTQPLGLRLNFGMWDRAFLTSFSGIGT